MRYALSLLVVLAVAGTASADIVSTQHFATQAEVDAAIIDGYYYIGHGDSDSVEMRVGATIDEVAFGLWNDTQSHAFEFSIDDAGLGAFAIDDVYRYAPSVEAEYFDSLLVTVRTDDPNVSILVDELMLFSGVATIEPVAATAGAADVDGEDYLLIETDFNLAEGFVLFGNVTMDWTGDMPAADNAWFQVTPVVVPEPAGVLLAAAGPLLLRRRRS